MSTNPPNPLEGYLDLHQCQQESGIRIDALRKATREGVLPSIKIGGSQGPRLVRKDDLTDFMNSRIRKITSFEKQPMEANG